MAECARLLPHLLTVCEHAQRLRVAEDQAGSLLGRASTYLREHAFTRVHHRSNVRCSCRGCARAIGY